MPTVHATILERMRYARWLAVAGGVLVFLGSLLVAAGISQLTIGFNFVVVAPTADWTLGIAAGVVLLGLGAMLGFFAIAVKGPSLSWAEAARLSAQEAATRMQEVRRAAEDWCPRCEGALLVPGQPCPHCGYLPGASEPPKS